MSAKAGGPKISEAEAIAIATKFAKSKGAIELKWELVTAHFNKAGDEAGYANDTWSVVFPWDLPANVISSPDRSVVLVDAKTGKAKWFQML